MIDLHVHSTASDGTSSPEELAARGRDFALMALTDHDNCDGGRRFLSACLELGIAAPRWAGIELSLEPGKGHGEFHMLGLGINPESTALEGYLKKICDGRNERNLAMVKKLNDIGVAIAFEDVVKHAGGEIVARPHFARALIEKGYASDVKDAFLKYLGHGAPAYVSRFHPSPESAIKMIHAAGGLAVMAHPNLWTENFEELEENLKRLKDFGLDGIEAIYQANHRGVTVEHLLMANRLDLLVTAGSDFHGMNKVDIKLGMTVQDEAAFIEPLLARWAAYQAPQAS